MMVWMIANMAIAGVLPEGAQSTYSGVSIGTWSAFESNGNIIPVSKQDDLSVLQVLNYNQVTYGIQAGLDVTYVLPVSYVRVPGKQGGVGTHVGSRTSRGVYSARILAFGTNCFNWKCRRFTGLLHAGTRDRLTNVGDGTTQLRLGLQAEDVETLVWDT